MFLTKLKNGCDYVYFTDINGQRNKTSTRTKSKTEAKQFLISFQTTFGTRKKEKLEPLTLKQFRWKFLKHSESYHSWKTTLDYKSTFNEMEEYFGNILLTEFTQRSIEEFIQMKIRKRSLHTGRRHLINIKAMFNKAVAYGYLETSPAKNIKRIKPPERLPMFFPKEEFSKLLETIDNNYWKDLVEFAVKTGLRKMEILNLKETNIFYNHKPL